MEKQISNLRLQRNFFMILALLLVATNVYLFIEINQTDKVVETLVIEKETINEEKDALVKRLEKLKDEYAAMSKEYDDLDSLFIAERDNVNMLLNKVRSLKGDVSGYKQRVNGLEFRLKEYMVQIEELQAKNQELTAENVQVKTDLDSARREMQLLSMENENLESKVEQGAALKAYDLVSDCIRFRSNGQEAPTEKVKKLEKIRACFILSENPLTPKGKKSVYVRVADPTGVIITDAADDAHSFEFQNKKILYTMKQEIDYQGKAIDLCLYWTKKKELLPGSYTVDVFVDGMVIGTSGFSLEK
jgi:DNA repair exonuclease SbcCD ATPase subunit